MKSTPPTPSRSPREISGKRSTGFCALPTCTIKADEFVDAATLNPAFEESAMFENMLDLMFGGEFDAYVFDTAPTANARRLLGMSQVYSLWVDKMMNSREEAKSLRQLLSFSKKKEEADPSAAITARPAGSARRRAAGAAAVTAGMIAAASMRTLLHLPLKRGGRPPRAAGRGSHRPLPRVRGRVRGGGAFRRARSRGGPLTIEGELIAKSTGTVSPFSIGDRVFHQSPATATSPRSTATS